MLQRVLEVAVITLAPWRPLRAALSSRFAAAYPELSTRLRVVFAFLALGVITLWVAAPEWLLFGALAVTLFTAVERWRARPAWGQGRGLPPGSLGIFADMWADQRFYYKQAARHGAIFKISNFMRPTVCVLGLERGQELLRDHETKLETPQLPFGKYVPGGLLRYMHDPGHQHYRTILRRAFSPQLLEQFVPRFSTIVQRTLGEFCAASFADEAGLTPLPRMNRLMLDLWLPLFFAIDPESLQGEELRSLLPTIDIQNPKGASPLQIHSAVRRISVLLEREIDAWGAQPPPCLLGAIKAEEEADARDPVVIGNLLYLLHTSSTDMSALLCWLLKMMCNHPGWMESLGRPNGLAKVPAPASLETRIVMETLRLWQSEFIYRSAAGEIRFRGFRIPKGWLIRICVWESHRDPQVFADPDDFNPDRFLERTYSRAEYSPFGMASHACLASQLAILAGSIFVRELAGGFRLTATNPGTIELGSYRHWKPDNAFRVRLEARS